MSGVHVNSFMIRRDLFDLLGGYDERFGDDAASAASVARSLAARRSPGGTAPERVREALAEAKAAFAG